MGRSIEAIQANDINFPGGGLEGKSPTSDSRKHLQVVNYFFPEDC